MAATFVAAPFGRAAVPEVQALAREWDLLIQAGAEGSGEEG